MAEQVQANGHSISHTVKSLQHILRTTPTPNSTLFCKSRPIITPMFFFFQLLSAQGEGETELDEGCTWKINLTAHTHLHIHCGSPAGLGGPGGQHRVRDWAALSQQLLRSARLGPVNVWTWKRLCTCNRTWQNSHSFQLYTIIWCQTTKQIPTVYTKKTALHLQKIVSHTD